MQRHVLTMHLLLSVLAASELQPPPQRDGTPRLPDALCVCGPEQYGRNPPTQRIHFQPASSSPSAAAAASFCSGATAALHAGLSGASLLHSHPCTERPLGATFSHQHSHRTFPAAHTRAAPDGAPEPDTAAHLGAGAAPQHAGKRLESPSLPIKGLGTLSKVGFYL